MPLIQYFTLSTLVFVTAVCHGSANAQSDQTIRWMLKQGEKLSAVLEQNTGIATEIGNRTQEIGNKMIMTMDWTVESANENQFVIQQSINRIQLTINTPNENGIQEINLDTENDDVKGSLAQHLLTQISPLIGISYKVTMTNRGEINQVDIPKDSLEIIRQAPASMQIREVISEAGLKELLGQSAIVFPEKELNPGQQWSDRSKLVNAIGEIQKLNQYTYDGPHSLDEGSFHQFSVQTGIEPKTLNQNVIVVNFEGQGKIWFAAEDDLMLKSQVSNRMTTKRKYRDKTIESTVTTEVRMKVRRQDG